MRAAEARLLLDCVQHGGPRSVEAVLPAPAELPFASLVYGVARALGAHGWLVALVLLVACGEALGGWSAWLMGAEPGRHSLGGDTKLARLASATAGQIISAPPRFGAELQAVTQASAAAPIAPAQSAPLAVSDAFREVHLLGAGETLGDLARRYGVSLEAIIWSNGLEGGDALMLGQPLRIPRISGAAHTVGQGETVADVATRFGVRPEAILAFGPNHFQDGRELTAGSEIFIPSSALPLPEALLSQGGLDALAARGAEPAGVVSHDETNLREGPGTDYVRQIQLDRGRRVALLARHASWLKVKIAGVTGWVRADLLQIAGGLIEGLPETNDFPPPPPRWVWPAWGALSSGFGSRWGAFHNGIDIANQAWTPIVAARAGRVIEAGWCSGYGYCVKISHGGGVETIYGHLITKPKVSAGDEVSAGQRIGSMGSTYDRAGGGYSTGVHLHFTVLVNGRAVNPLTVLP